MAKKKRKKKNNKLTTDDSFTYCALTFNPPHTDLGNFHTSFWQILNRITVVALNLLLALRCSYSRLYTGHNLR